MSLGFIIIPTRSIHKTTEKEMNEKVSYLYNNAKLANNRVKGRMGGGLQLAASTPPTSPKQSRLSITRGTS